MKIRLSIITMMFYFVMSTCLSQNEISSDMKTVIQLLKLDLDKIDTDLSIERPMRYIPEMMAFAVLEKIGVSDYTEEGHFSYKCHVVLYNASDKIITNRYVIQNLESDAIRLTSFNFDFAPYIVKENIRAFGLRINYVGSSRPNPLGEEKFTLFVTEKDKLVPILKDFTSYMYSGEWDTNCAGEFNEEKAIFAMEKDISNGYFNILVNYKNWKTVNIPAANGDCDSKVTVTKSADILVYNKDRQYHLKKK